MSVAEDEVLQAWWAVAGEGHVDVEAALVERHAERGRHYHTAEHVMWVLRHVDSILDDSDADTVHGLDADAIHVAALFHDIVYDARSTTNEAASATIAVAAIAGLGWDADRQALVRTMIEATAGHDASTPEAAILLDADLAVLGSGPDAYAQYVANVRAEYAFVDDAAWRTGRAAVLRSFLDRDHVFVTPTMAAAREAQARTNLAAELRALEH